MGHGIAIQFASHGFKVILNDVSEERLASSINNIESTSIQANLDTNKTLGGSNWTRTINRPVFSLAIFDGRISLAREN